MLETCTCNNAYSRQLSFLPENTVAALPGISVAGFWVPMERDLRSSTGDTAPVGRLVGFLCRSPFDQLS